MNIQLSPRDMAFYYGIPYDIYDQDPEKWNKVIKIFLLRLPIETCPKDSVDNRIRNLNDLHDQDPEKWNKVVKIFLLRMEKEICNENSINNKVRDLIFKHKGIDTNLKHINLSASNDFNSDKNVIISYTAGSGGNFLNNCLYFNDSSPCITFIDETLRSIDFLVSTLDNIEEKLNYIISETEDQSVWNVWGDPLLELNCKIQDHKILIHKFHVISIEKTLLDGLQIYPNCKTIIYYKNTKLFKYLREYSGYIWWGVNKHLPSAKQTTLQFIEKSQETKKKLIDLCNDDDQVYSHCYIDSKITCYVWDTNWYFSERDTIDHIKELYELLSLSGFNENAISKYYNVWIKTLSDLKTKKLNETT